ncbi:MAG: hypothetical protein U0452_00055 [Anaerolineae bacterium]
MTGPVLLSSAILLSACGVLDGSEQRGTLAAEVTASLDEATTIARTLAWRTTEVAATAASAATVVFQLDGVNQQLAVTMRAAIPPTQQVVQDSGVVTPGYNAPLPGEWTPTPIPGSAAESDAPGVTPAPDTPNQVTAVGPALAVRDSDGCAVSIQTSIPASSPRIYATTRILSATAGTSVQAAWSMGGQVVFSNTPFTLPADDSDFCVWFYIEPTDVNFAPGEWSLQFLVNGQPSGNAATFSLTP